MQLATGSTAAYCGAKGSPQPPLHEAADAGAAPSNALPTAPSAAPNDPGAKDGGAP